MRPPHDEVLALLGISDYCNRKSPCGWSSVLTLRTVPSLHYFGWTWIFRSLGLCGWTDAPGLGEGYRLEMSLESLQGGRGKARSGQVNYSTYVQVMVVLLDTTQNHKEWWSGAQLHPLVLCLSLTSHSCSEEPGPHHLHLSALFSSSDYMYNGLRIASY